MSELKYSHGRLSYRKKSTGQERGREDWSLTRNRDGTRTMRCLAMTDDSKFVRDVIYTLGANLNPADVFVRLQVEDRLVGAGYFRAEGTSIRAVVDGDLTGYTVQTVRMPGRFHISTHAVILDGWLFWSYDLKRGGIQVLTTYSTSPMWNGTTGPLGGLSRVHANYVGEETVTVPAGRFKAHHFSIDSDSNVGADRQKVPTSHLWVTGEDNLLVRYDWGGLDLEYVLISLVAE